MSDVYIPQIDWWTEETPKTEVVQEEAFLWEICESQDFQEHFQKEFDKILQNKEQFSEAQKETLASIYCNLWDENPELKKAIETQTVKMFEVPGRDLVALSVDWRNLSAFYTNEWKYYFQMNLRREDIFKYTLFNKQIEKYWLEEIKDEKWNYILKKNWEELKTFSIKYYTALLEYVDFITGMFDFTRDLLEKKEQGLPIE